MPTYVIAAEEYYNGLSGGVRFSSPATYTGTDDNVALCKAPMKGVIERYALSGKAVLSLGSGTAFEEAWFHRAGCKLTLNDLDVPHHGIEPYLKSLTPVADTSAGALTFCIEDAAETVKRFADGRFDVLYISSFHPDEYRRGEIQREFAKRRSLLSRMKDPATWPPNTETHLDLMVNAFRTVKSGGLIIFQHYAFGVPMNSNPHYLAAVRDQFRAHGATLVEAFTFRRSTSKLLLVATRGDMAVAERCARSLQDRPEIRQFYGRYPFPEIKTDVVKVYDIARGGSLVSAAFPPSVWRHLDTIVNADVIRTVGKKILPESVRKLMRRMAMRLFSTAEK